MSLYFTVSCVGAVTPQLAGSSSTEVTPAEVTKYKDIIRDQDAEITQLREKVTSIETNLSQMEKEKENLAGELQQLSDENTGTVIHSWSSPFHRRIKVAYG